MSAPLMVDGFPLPEDDPERPIHERISATLETCRDVAPLHPTLGERFPLLFQTPPRERAAWLAPSLHRLDWNLENGNERWAVFFGPLVNLVLQDMAECGQSEFNILCKRSQFLSQHHCHALPAKIGRYGWDLWTKGLLSPGALAALENVIHELGWPGPDATAQLQMAWTLWRAGRTEPWCWSNGVARDLDGMPAPRRDKWLALLDANDHRLAGGLPKSAHQKLDRIDGAEFSSAFTRWANALAAMDPPEFSNAGLTLLVWLLRLCAAAHEWRLDEALYAISSSKWSRHDKLAWPGPSQPAWWIEPYLTALATRNETCRIACVEALAVNPATAAFPDVQRLYNTLLERTISQATPKPALGIDGFPLDPAGPLAMEHLLLDHHLREAHPDQFRGMMVQGPERLQPVRRMLLREVKAKAGEGLNHWTLALAERTKWLAGRIQDLHEHTALFWRVELGYLMAEALAELRDPPEDVLLAAIESDTLAVYGCRPTGRVLALTGDHIAHHGWTPALSGAMTRWEKTIFGSIHAQALRRHLGWILLFDESTAIKAVDCWGNRVRLDLRTLPLDERPLWLALLRNECFAITAKPPAKWMKPAKEAFATLGASRFRERFRAWFAPFRDGEELKLTVPGRDLLRVLFWYALIAADPAVDEALAWYGNAKWKNKASRDRADAGCPAFAYTLKQRNPELARQVFARMLASGAAGGGGKIEAAYRELCEQAGAAPLDVRPPAPPIPTPEQMALQMKEKITAQTSKAMKGMILQMLQGQQATWDGDTLVVKARGDTFRIEAVGSRITRQSDGAVVRVAIPWQLPQFAAFRNTVDAHDLRDPSQPNWMSVGMLARVLTAKDGSSRLEVDPVRRDD